MVVVVILGMLAFGVLWVVTPSASGLAAKVTAVQAAHDAPPAPADIATSKIAQALIATEDSRFYANPGVDPISVARVAYSAVTGGGNVGAATLEQQLAKNLYTPSETGVTAEIDQAMLALKLNQRYSKTEILSAYLSTVYFGQGYWGITAAAKGYFGLGVDQLDWAQASMLAGLVQAPSAYDPVTHLDLGKQRQRQVLDRLVATGVLTAAQADATYAAPLGLLG